MSAAAAAARCPARPVAAVYRQARHIQRAAHARAPEWQQGPAISGAAGLRMRTNQGVATLRLRVRTRRRHGNLGWRGATVDCGGGDDPGFLSVFFGPPDLLLRLAGGRPDGLSHARVSVVWIARTLCAAFLGTHTYIQKHSAGPAPGSMPAWLALDSTCQWLASLLLLEHHTRLIFVLLLLQPAGAVPAMPLLHHPLVLITRGCGALVGAAAYGHLPVHTSCHTPRAPLRVHAAMRRSLCASTLHHQRCHFCHGLPGDMMRLLPPLEGCLLCTRVCAWAWLPAGAAACMCAPVHCQRAHARQPPAQLEWRWMPAPGQRWRHPAGVMVLSCLVVVARMVGLFARGAVCMALGCSAAIRASVLKARAPVAFWGGGGDGPRGTNI